MCQLTDYRSKIIFKQAPENVMGSNNLFRAIEQRRLVSVGRKKSHIKIFISEDRQKTTPGRSKFHAMRYMYLIAPCTSPSCRILPMTSF